MTVGRARKVETKQSNIQIKKKMMSENFCDVERGPAPRLERFNHVSSASGGPACERIVDG